jgi:hypothetical protein
LGGSAVVKVDELFAVNFLAKGRKLRADVRNGKRRVLHTFEFFTKVRNFAILNGSKEAKLSENFLQQALLLFGFQNYIRNKNFF